MDYLCEREEIGPDYDNFFDLVLRERIVKSCTKDLQLWVLVHNPKSIREIISHLGSFQVAHKNSHPDGGHSQFGEKLSVRLVIKG